MSVEDIKNINELSKSLLDQGLVASREDAVAQAEKILNKKLAEPTTQQGSSEIRDDLERYKNIIERNKEYTERHLKNFKEEIESLIREIGILKQEISSLKTKGEAKSAQENGLANKEVEVDCSEEKKESHPKKGNFTSEDVSIEKIFYFGKK